MIKTAISEFLNIFDTPIELQTWPENRITENNLRLSANITLLSTYYGCIDQDQRGQYLGALASRFTSENDFILLIIASNKITKEEPENFYPAISVQHDDIAVSVFYKKHRKNDPIEFKVKRKEKEMFVVALTFRGPDILVDSDGFIDTGSGFRGLAYTPRVRTALEGALISIFYYDDPLQVEIKNQVNLISRCTNSKGIAVGVSNQLGGRSKRVKAIADNEVHGKGDDIAVAVSIF